MQIAFRAVQQLVFYGKLLFNEVIAELNLARGLTGFATNVRHEHDDS
jgi:hypothetical protein